MRRRLLLNDFCSREVLIYIYIEVPKLAWQDGKWWTTAAMISWHSAKGWRIQMRDGQGPVLETSDVFRIHWQHFSHVLGQG